MTERESSGRKARRKAVPPWPHVETAEPAGEQTSSLEQSERRKRRLISQSQKGEESERKKERGRGESVPL